MEALNLVNNLPGSTHLGFRDAIHIPMVVMKMEKMNRDSYFHPQAGDPVMLKPGTRDTVIPVVSGQIERHETLGILNPYMTWDDTGLLSDKERRDGYCYVTVFLKPGTSTGVTHHYTHPLLDDTRQLGVHEGWLRSFAASWGFNYDEMIETGTDVGRNGASSQWDKYITAHGVDLHSEGELGTDLARFWEHLEGLNRERYPQENRAKLGWSCSC